MDEKKRTAPAAEPFDVEAERAAIGVEAAYTTLQVAEIFGLSDATIRREIEKGKLKASRPDPARGWRITREACREWSVREGRFIVKP